MYIQQQVFPLFQLSQYWNQSPELLTAHLLLCYSQTSQLSEVPTKWRRRLDFWHERCSKHRNVVSNLYLISVLLWDFIRRKIVALPNFQNIQLVPSSRVKQSKKILARLDPC
jgi:hypothetical protein